MYELISAGKDTFYIDCPAKMGVYRISDTEAILIDSGSDKDAAKKALKHLDAQGWTLRAVINTHSHADHIGGNHLLQQRTGCPIYGSAAEGCTVKHPILEPTLLYGGYPFRELRNKFLMAQPTESFSVMDEQGMVCGERVLPEGMELMRLPGHAMDMIGVKTPDDVWFMADCVSSAEILAKYHIGFIYDVGEYLATLARVENMEAALFVPSHTQPVSRMAELVKLNRDKVMEIGEVILAICKEPTAFEEILARLFTHYNLAMDFNQYVLVGSTVRSYLSWLSEEGRLSAAIDDNRMIWNAL